MNLEALKQQLIEHEGLRLKPYRCPAGRLTIGVGRNLDDHGITKGEAMMLLDHDIWECVADCEVLFQGVWERLSDSRQRAIVDMRFNLGPFALRTFSRLIAAVNAEDFKRAAGEMKDSAWYRQVGKRGERLVAMMWAG